ncbi:MAG: hypothetical protein H0T73_07385 [Ardenticatenales bacterium]|nr:hypothetical protein [Ardenticatenales bacterium]
MWEQKARLERAAILMFLRALRLHAQRELTIREQRERPDFMVTDEQGRCIGVEVTHLYHNEAEARYLNGHNTQGIHPITTLEELLDALNKGLRHKALLSYGYDPFDGLLLLIRVPSPRVQKQTILDHLEDLLLPPSAFNEIWMLFYDYDHLDWADLLQLNGKSKVKSQRSKVKSS